MSPELSVYYIRSCSGSGDLQKNSVNSCPARAATEPDVHKWGPSVQPECDIGWFGGGSPGASRGPDSSVTVGAV